MQFETKFTLGQTVHVFARRHHELFDLCPQCGGRGEVTFPFADGSGEGKTYCPGECRRGKVRSVFHDVWEHAGTARIGRVEVTAYEPTLAPDIVAGEHYAETYMVDTTGVGSGTLYTYDGQAFRHQQLFASREEGESWASIANAPLEAEANEKRALLKQQAAA